MTLRSDLTAINSQAATLLKTGVETGSTSIAAGTSIPIGSTITRTVVLPVPTAESDGIYSAMIDGTGWSHADGNWVPIMTRTRIQDSSAPVQYYVDITTYRNSTGQVISFLFTNNLGGAPVSLPALTINAKATYFTYPWE